MKLATNASTSPSPGLRTRLSTRLTILFVLLSINPLAVVGYLAYDNGRRTIEQSTLNRLISTTILKQSEFERWIDDSEQSLMELARRPSIREYAAVMASRDPSTGSGRDPADPEYRAAHGSILEDHLKPTLEEEESLLDLSILRGDDGLILVSTNGQHEGKYKESQPYFLEGRSRTYVQNTYYSLTLGEAAMAIGTPIRDREGNLIAVLAGHVDLAEMSKIMMQRSGLSATEETYLVNKFNFFVTESRFEPGYALKKALHTEGVEACLAHNDGVGFYDDYRGVPVIGAYRWMPERELCILTEVDQAEAFAPIVALRKTVLGIGVGVALVVAALGLIFARTITGPLRQLVKGAQAIGRGDLETRIEVRARDEIGQLAGAFNEMAADLRRSLGALRESEAKYRNLTESLDELIYRADPETLVATYVNRAVERIYGYTVEEFLGDPTLWESTIHPEDKERVFAWFTEAQRKMESGAIEYRIIRKDKTVRWVEDHVSWEKDQQGNLVSMTGVMYDITERKRAEEELSVAYDALASSISGVIITDLEGKIRYANPAFLRMFEYEDRDRAIGKRAAESFPAERVQKLSDVQAIIDRVEGETEEFLVQHRDGTVFHVEVSSSVVTDKEGNDVGQMASFVDITERKQAEEALKEYSERLEEMVEERTRALRDAQEQLVRSEKLAVLGQLAGGVGHELRNPLGAVKNAAYFLRMVLQKPEPDVAEMLQILDREVDNCERIISSLLDFAQPRELALRQVHLPEVIEEALARTTVPNLPAQAGNVEVLTRYAEALPLITADPDQLGLVFGNLILNAVQAMPGGGRLTITAAYVEGGTVRNPQSAIRIQVSDTGVGISEEHMGKIFEPLFTTKAKGMGLGLAVSKTLLERHGGTIEVESQVGKGTTFTVRLPLAGERGS